MFPFLPDLGRMYNLVSRIQDGLGELKKLLETHIHNQGLAAIEKCGEAALNASISSNVVSCGCLIFLCSYVPHSKFIMIWLNGIQKLPLSLQKGRILLYNS